MRVTFTGVGEAFDEQITNTSLLVESETTSLLIDCGFTAATPFWRLAERPLELDALYITHFHGDHYFGVPALLIRWVEESRVRPLTIIGQDEVQSRVEQLMALAYPNTLGKAEFPIHYVKCSPDKGVAIGDMGLRFAFGDHPMPCLAVRVESEGKTLFYSSDGRPTDATGRLAAGCDLVVHESFTLEPETPGHGTVDSAIDFGMKAGAKHIALVHIKRCVRRERMQEILDKCTDAQGVEVIVPEPCDSIEI